VAAVPRGYVLGPGDQITVVGSEPDEIINKPVRIDAQGFVTLPLTGRLRAGGITVEQFQTNLQAALRTWVLDPQVSVNVSDYRSQHVSVIGAVTTPGIQVLQGRKTVAEVLAQAGGIRQDAGYTLRITRPTERGKIPLPGAQADSTGRFTVADVEIDQLVKSGAFEQNIAVEPGDVLSVPRGEMIYVLGNVRRPGGFIIHERDSMSVLQALSLAEGVTGIAATKKARILRKVSGQPDRAQLEVNLNAILSTKTKDVRLLPEDILYVPSSATKAIAARAAEAALAVGTGLLIYRP
jgi:polysaccharide export outer membrane protein